MLSIANTRSSAKQTASGGALKPPEAVLRRLKSTRRHYSYVVSQC
jgi:hypothetical protein